MILALNFHSSGWLWMLIAVAALAAGYVAMQQRRKQYAVRFTNVALLDVVAPKRPGWRRHVTASVFLVAAACMVVALARPARDERVPRERATVVMAIDTSLSMEAVDVAPSRLVAAQQAAKQFLDAVPETINVGLVTFNGFARVLVPPTIDRTLVAQAIDRLELDEGTAIGEAILASLDALQQAPPAPVGATEEVPSRVVLMSDGETTVGRPNETAVAAAKEAGVAVSTIAFGTDAGTVTITDPATGASEIVQVPVNAEALQDIADGTGGSFFAAASEKELGRVYEDIGSSIGYETKEKEITTWFVGVALMMLLAAAGLSLAWFARLP